MQLNYKKLRSFKIRKIHELITFKLNLLKTMKVYSIFYKLLLKLYYNLNVILGLVEIDKKDEEP